MARLAIGRLWQPVAACGSLFLSLAKPPRQLPVFGAVSLIAGRVVCYALRRTALPTCRMAVIVSPSPICTPPPPPHDPDFTTPRSLHALDIVAVAAATIPTLPLDPPTNSAYRLTTKRKSDQSQEDDDDDDDDSSLHHPKRWKSDLLSTEYRQSLLSIPLYPSHISLSPHS